MTRAFITSLLAGFLGLSLWAQNPIAEFYGAGQGYPGWTDAILWEHRIDMSTYSKGENDFERFENARDELFDKGGGVLYYPAGSYDFSDLKTGPSGRGLMLKSGVVILGEKPSLDSLAADGSLELPTRFIFPFRNMGTIEDPKYVPYHWNLVGITRDLGQELKEIDRVGIAWVHLDGAVIYFGPQLTWGGEQYQNAGGWRSSKVFGSFAYRKPDGSFPLDPFCGARMNETLYEGAGQGRFVFGCILSNSALHNDFIDDGFGEGGYFPYKFVARIGIYGSRILVANNLLPEPTRSFLYEQHTSEGPKTILYDYAFNTGIDVNKNHLNICANKLSPEGGYWEEGVIIKDNWVYNHLFKGFDISGTWMTVQNNTNAHDVVSIGNDIYGLPEGWTLTANGYKTHLDNGSSDAFQNRAFDVAGKAVWLDRNEYWGTGTPKPSNDGEGILCQAHGGTQMHSWALTRNYGHDDGRGYGYMAGWDVDNLGVLMAWNDSPTQLGAFKVSDREMIDVSFVDNRIGEELKADCGELSCDVLTDCPEASPLPPSEIDVDADDAGAFVDISWTDASENEIGFRVDRRPTGTDPWYTIAYRPRHSLGHADNDQRWRDFMAASGTDYEYRVVAVNCEDGSEGAIYAGDAVRVSTRVATPVVSPPGGSYAEAQTITLDCPTFGAEIRYTLDGSEPAEGSEIYTSPITLGESALLRAKAFREDIVASYILEESYEISTSHSPEGSASIPFRVYPQPATASLFMEFESSLTGNIQLQLYRMDGAEVWSYRFSSRGSGQILQLPLPDQAGSYLLQWHSGNKIYRKILLVR